MLGIVGLDGHPLLERSDHAEIIGMNTPASLSDVNTSDLPTPYFEINGYQARAEIGCAPDEHGVQQGVLVDLRIHVRPEPGLYLDRYDMAYDYMAAVEAIESSLSLGHHILQEGLALAIAQRVLAHPAVVRVDVRIRKTERYDSVDSIGFFSAFDRALLARIDAQRGAGAA
jgi:dihydroneopterin aldolase